MLRIIAKKHTHVGPEIKFVSIIRSQIREICTTKDPERLVIQFLMHNDFKKGKKFGSG